MLSELNWKTMLLTISQEDIDTAIERCHNNPTYSQNCAASVAAQRLLNSDKIISSCGKITQLPSGYCYGYNNDLHMFMINFDDNWRENPERIKPGTYEIRNSKT